jgi:ribosomal protein S18 acetylase RimI-like enzyme
MSPADLELMPPPPAPAATRIVYREVLDTIDPDFDRAIELDAAVFPAAERMTREEFVVALEARRAGRMSPDNFRFLVARRAGRILGMCSGRFIERLDLGFVGYLVVDPGVQGQRIGSALRRHLVHGFRRDALLAGLEDLEAVVGEVEADNTWISILVGRRKVLALDVPYAQPPLRPGMLYTLL